METTPILPLTHVGLFSPQSRLYTPLVFLESYISSLSSISHPPVNPTTFYAPLAIYHDPQGQIHVGAEAISVQFERFMKPFENIKYELVEATVLNGGSKVYAEFLTRFWFKGEEDEVNVPMIFVWDLVVGEGRWRIERGKGWWDMAILGRWVSEKRRERERKTRKIRV